MILLVGTVVGGLLAGSLSDYFGLKLIIQSTFIVTILGCAVFLYKCDISLISLCALFVMGAVRNWCWLCDPVGKPYAHLLGRTGRRIFFFAAGSLLVVCGAMIEFHS